VKEFDMEPETVKALREGREVPGADPKELALIRFTRKIAEDATQMEAQDFQDLKDCGLDESAIIEVLSVVALSALTNAFASALKLEQDIDPAALKDYF